jgi:hypothetical protein
VFRQQLYTFANQVIGLGAVMVSKKILSDFGFQNYFGAGR